MTHTCLVSFTLQKIKKIMLFNIMGDNFGAKFQH